MTSTPTTRRNRCALFVDFDNVYIGLRRLDPAAAEAFATDPGRWLTRLEAGEDSEGDFERRFLVRNCYLNPSVFSQFRPNFTRAGFRVVDCPSLTQQGKSSADINLVLDAVDALNAPTSYDEFVIASADADFTPLVQRCRAEDRRVTIITASPAASAYRSVADSVVGADDLVDLVTADVPEADPARPETSTPTGAPAATEPARRGGGAAASRGPKATTVPPETATAAAPSPARRAILRQVRSAPRPILASVIAHAAQKADPELPTGNWAGAGGFFAWVARDLPEVGLSSKAPGYVWDPKRFGEADLPGAVAEVDRSSLQRQVVSVTDTPGLTTKQYRTVLTALANDVSKTPFVRAETSKRVREAARSAGALVGRATVNSVISGVLFGGQTLQGTTTPRECAAAWADNVVGLCRGARMELTDADVAAIRAWVGGGLLEG